MPLLAGQPRLGTQSFRGVPWCLGSKIPMCIKRHPCSAGMCMLPCTAWAPVQTTPASPMPTCALPISRASALADAAQMGGS